MRIFLLGYMGSGKSTLGKKLAQKLQLDFIDLDKSIEEEIKISIAEYFSIYGESEFRKIEHQTLLNSLISDNYVMACGGGTPVYFDNLPLMNKYGITIYLEMTENAIFSRLQSGIDSRPLLKNKSEEELKEYIHNHLSERQIYYKQADLIVNGLSVKPDQLIQAINNLTK